MLSGPSRHHPELRTCPGKPAQSPDPQNYKRQQNGGCVTSLRFSQQIRQDKHPAGTLNFTLREARAYMCAYAYVCAHACKCTYMHLGKVTLTDAQGQEVSFLSASVSDPYPGHAFIIKHYTAKSC